MTRSLVGFEVVAFGPFIPCFDIAQALADRQFIENVFGSAQRMGEEFGCGVMENNTASSAARGVVPIRADAGIVQWVVR